MVAFPGRLEAAYVVPSGTTVSVSNGAQSAATSVTWPAGSYYHSEAGGVSSGLSALQTAINNAVQGYPTTAAAMQEAVGYGTWSAGWLFNITSGNDSGSFGGVTFTAVSSPTYGHEGPKAGIDLMVGFDSVADAFDAGANFDVNATDDLIGAIVVYATTIAGNEDIWGKDNGTTGYILVRESDKLALYVRDGVDTVRVEASITALVPYICMFALDRSLNQVRIATIPFYGGAALLNAASSTTAVGTLANAATFTVGDNGTYRAGGTRIAATWIGEGTGVASGLVTNLSTAISNLQSALNSGFTVAMSTDGRITLSNSFWPCSIDFTSTDARDLLGFEYEFNYPATAAQMNAACLNGSWTAGYLCNESATPLLPVFGSASLAATSTPTYSNLGPRGGTDKAIGFDSVADAFSGGDVYDADTDLMIILVAKLDSGVTNGDIVGKGWSVGAAGQVEYILVRESTTTLKFYIKQSGGTTYSPSCTVPNNEWFVAMAALDRTANTVRVGVQGLVTGTQSLSTNTSVSLAATGNSVAFLVGDNGIYRADLGCKIAALYVGTGASAAAGACSSMATMLTAFATYMKSQTGTQQARTLWFPDSPLNLADDPRTAPIQNDHRTTTSPTGNTYGLCGNEFYEHQDVTWEMVPIDRYREASATYANASFETFWRDHCGMGHAWIGPSAALQIYWNNAGNLETVGSDESISGWHVVGAGGIRDVAKKHSPTWTGYWTIRFPKIVSDG